MYIILHLQYTVSVSVLVLLKDGILCEAVHVHCCPLYVLSMVRDNTDLAMVPLLWVTPDTDFPGQLHDNVATGLPPLSWHVKVTVVPSLYWYPAGCADIIRLLVGASETWKFESTCMKVTGQGQRCTIVILVSRFMCWYQVTSWGIWNM